MSSPSIKIGSIQFTTFQSVCFVIGTLAMLVLAASSFLPWTRLFGSYSLGFQPSAQIGGEKYDGITGIANIIVSLIILSWFGLFLASKKLGGLKIYLVISLVWSAPLSLWLGNLHFELGTQAAFGLSVALGSSVSTALLNGLLYHSINKMEIQQGM